MYNVTCPYCGASTEVDAEWGDCFCSFCGKKIVTSLQNLEQDSPIAMQSLFCWNCGKEVVDGAEYCHSCGVAQKPDSMGENPYYQTKTPQKCLNCGYIVNGEVNICPLCGQKFEGVILKSSYAKTLFTCPRCKSFNIRTLSVEEHTVQKKKKKRRRNSFGRAMERNFGCLYWLFFGWWYWLLFGWWIELLRLVDDEEKTTTTKTYICKRCGYTWDNKK